MACPQCEYDMTANAGGRCPECGAEWTGVIEPLPEEIDPWRTRIEAFLCCWAGCVLSFMFCSAFLAALVFTTRRWF